MPLSKCDNCGETLPPVSDAFCSYCQHPVKKLEENPFQAPEHSSSSNTKSGESSKAPLIGCGIGGCLVPGLLMLLSGLLGGLGSPIFWPMIVLFFGCLGYFVGVARSRMD